MNDRLTILLYHDVSEDDAARLACACPKFTTTVKRLARHVELVRSRGLVPVAMNAWLAGDLPESEHGYAMFTFDGPHAGWFDHVLPLFSRLKVPASFFVTAGWVGEEHLYPESRHLGWDDLRRLAAAGKETGLFDLQNHSMRHTELVRTPDESPEAFEKRLHEEIVLASRRIQEETGCRPSAFAPPKGKGNMDALAPFLDQAGLAAVRWASLPGRANTVRTDPRDLQISYCDIVRFSEDDFALCLDTPEKLQAEPAASARSTASSSRA